MRRAALLAAAAALVLAPMPQAAIAAPGPPNAPEYWFDDWHVQSLWDSGARGQGITIAEIDTGVNAQLPELRGKILTGIDYGRSGNGQIDREIDGFGHGTAMASIMVARPGLLGITGLAPDAKILPIAVALSGTTDAERPDKLPEAIRYAVDHKAKIINMSLGGKRSAKRDGVPCSTDEQNAVYYAMRKGAVVIASVGNTGPTDNTVEDPGVCLGVISVGAVDSTGEVADFSGRQPYLTLVAPGVEIASLGREPGTAYSGDGTSQATALTSAAAALVWSAHPDWDGSAVAARILATLDGRRTTPSPSLGYGQLNAYRAVTDSSAAGGDPSGAAAASSRANPVYAAAAPFASRAEALAEVAAHPPPPAAKPLASTGSFEVATHPRVTPEVITGIALAGAGALLLLVLLAFGVRGRGRRRLVAAGPPLPIPLEGVPSAVHAVWTTPPAPVALQAAPRPRPRPGPGRITPTVGPVAARPAASLAAARPRPRPRPRP